MVTIPLNYIYALFPINTFYDGLYNVLHHSRLEPALRMYEPQGDYDRAHGPWDIEDMERTLELAKRLQDNGRWSDAIWQDVMQDDIEEVSSLRDPVEGIKFGAKYRTFQFPEIEALPTLVPEDKAVVGFRFAQYYHYDWLGPDSQGRKHLVDDKHVLLRFSALHNSLSDSIKTYLWVLALEELFRYWQSLYAWEENDTSDFVYVEAKKHQWRKVHNKEDGMIWLNTYDTFFQTPWHIANSTMVFGSDLVRKLGFTQEKLVDSTLHYWKWLGETLWITSFYGTKGILPIPPYWHESIGEDDDVDEYLIYLEALMPFMKIHPCCFPHYAMPPLQFLDEA